MSALPDEQRIRSARNVALVVYALYALSFFYGVTGIVGVIVAYVKRGDADGTWVRSHFDWQTGTFWWGLFFSLIGLALIWLGVGLLILGVVWVWTIYRVVKGWLRLNDGRPVE